MARGAFAAIAGALTGFVTWTIPVSLAGGFLGAVMGWFQPGFGVVGGFLYGALFVGVVFGLVGVGFGWQHGLRVARRGGSVRSIPASFVAVTIAEIRTGKPVE